ncbi:MAG: hypothetical protein IPI30_01175 [Saprospiraceae bacterium]|nr:hypothetical protein [Candidatus Vicinibacter affinis]
MYRQLAIFFLIFGPKIIYGQVSQNSNCDTLVVDTVLFVGLEKTKPWVILLETRIVQGEKISINTINQKVKEIETDLIRTNLFSLVEVKYVIELSGHCNLSFHIYLRENWLVFPSIIFELADRNFNVWWNTFNHSIKRINLGLKLYHYNLTGRKDKLKVLYHTGYTDKHELSYEYPYISKRNNVGLKIGGLYQTFHEVNFLTKQNEAIFYKNERDVLLYRSEVYSECLWRPNRIWTYRVVFGFYKNVIHSSLGILNPDYLLSGNTKQEYFKINLEAQYSTLDNVSRPKSGIRIFGGLTKTGLGIKNEQNLFNLSEALLAAVRLNKRTRSVIFVAAGHGITRKKPAFNLYRSLGYQNQLEGYEYYIIDGLDYFYGSSGIYLELMQFRKGIFKPLRSEPKIKLDAIVDIKVNFNVGYVKDPFYSQYNPLSNEYLYSITTGLDILLNNTLKLQINYSINHLKEKGIFIHTKSAF